METCLGLSSRASVRRDGAEKTRGRSEAFLNMSAVLCKAFGFEGQERSDTGGSTHASGYRNSAS